MKKLLIILSILSTITYANTLLMNVLDNEDNTITIEGMYKTFLEKEAKKKMQQFL